MKQFNTSGPNIPEEHYTLYREAYLKKGVELVRDRRYFTIWAPRQTGKSTYFRQLAERVTGLGYEVCHINFENYKDEHKEAFLGAFRQELTKFWGLDFTDLSIAQIFQVIKNVTDRKLVLIIDEIEGINPEYFGSFLHSIRNAYHSRTEHGLKSVILVGVTNIVGLVQDNASPFNIAENLNLPYFTEAETLELLTMHEQETGQLFEPKVKRKIHGITAGQPGLVNGFANRLVTEYPDEKILGLSHYLEVEHWYLNVAIDKNVANILNKAAEFRPLVERLLFTETKIPFKIDRPAVKALHTNGIIRPGAEGWCEFWVPLYRKRLFDAFYPYTNGEADRIGMEVQPAHYLTPAGGLDVPKLIDRFREYVHRRGFGVYREKTDEKDGDGNPVYKSIPEAAMVYAFETFIQAVVQQLGGKTYREAQTAQGRTDLLVNINGGEILVETKLFSGAAMFNKGKSQLAYYTKHLGLDMAVYLVFIPEHILPLHKEYVHDAVETIEGIEILTYITEYEDELADYRKRKPRKRK